MASSVENGVLNFRKAYTGSGSGVDETRVPDNIKEITALVSASSGTVAVEVSFDTWEEIQANGGTWIVAATTTGAVTKADVKNATAFRVNHGTGTVVISGK